MAQSTAAINHRPQRAPDQPLFPRSSRPRQRIRSAETASYTHIRATETEAVLACRLLLEKKKT
ncbi:hypothetical protein, partial [Amycolatopsis circi]|uniref:hypothetical protein n=1 Tax=Amycolatopsis circi TaxID=871959 RepID=UPI001ABEFACF